MFIRGRMLSVSRNTFINPPLHGLHDALMNPWGIPDCFAARHNTTTKGVHIAHSGCTHKFLYNVHTNKSLVDSNQGWYGADNYSSDGIPQCGSKGREEVPCVGKLSPPEQCNSIVHLRLLSTFTEELLKLYFQNIPPPRANKALPSLEMTTHRIRAHSRITKVDGICAIVYVREYIPIVTNMIPFAVVICNLWGTQPEGLRPECGPGRIWLKKPGGGGGKQGQREVKRDVHLHRDNKEQSRRTRNVSPGCPRGLPSARWPGSPLTSRPHLPPPRLTCKIRVIFLRRAKIHGTVYTRSDVVSPLASALTLSHALARVNCTRLVGHSGLVVRLRASHRLGEPGSVSSGVAFQFEGIVPDNAAGRRFSSGISLPPPNRFFLPMPPHVDLASPPSAHGPKSKSPPPPQHHFTRGRSHDGRRFFVGIPGRRLRANPFIVCGGRGMPAAWGGGGSEGGQGNPHSVMRHFAMPARFINAVMARGCLICIVQRYDGNTARLARRSDEVLELRVSVARIGPTLLDLGCGGPSHSLKAPAYLALFSSFEADKPGSRKGYFAARFKCAVVSAREYSELACSDPIVLLVERLWPGPVQRLCTVCLKSRYLSGEQEVPLGHKDAFVTALVNGHATIGRFADASGRKQWIKDEIDGSFVFWVLNSQLTRPFTRTSHFELLEHGQAETRSEGVVRTRQRSDPRVQSAWFSDGSIGGKAVRFCNLETGYIATRVMFTPHTKDEVDRSRWLCTTNLSVSTLNFFSAYTSIKNGVVWILVRIAIYGCGQSNWNKQFESYVYQCVALVMRLQQLQTDLRLRGRPNCHGNDNLTRFIGEESFCSSNIRVSHSFVSPVCFVVGPFPFHFIPKAHASAIVFLRRKDACRNVNDDEATNFESSPIARRNSGCRYSKPFASIDFSSRSHIKWGRSGTDDRYISNGALMAQWIERFQVGPQSRTPGFSHVGIVSDDAIGRRVFSGISRFPRHLIPALLHTHLNNPQRLSRPRLLELKKRNGSVNCKHEQRAIDREMASPASNMAETYFTGGSPTNRKHPVTTISAANRGRTVTSTKRKLSSSKVVQRSNPGEGGGVMNFPAVLRQFHASARKGATSHLRSSQWRNDANSSIYSAVKFSLVPNNNANFADRRTAAAMSAVASVSPRRRRFWLTGRQASRHTRPPSRVASRTATDSTRRRRRRRIRRRSCSVLLACSSTSGGPPSLPEGASSRRLIRPPTEGKLTRSTAHVLSVPFSHRVDECTEEKQRGEFSLTGCSRPSPEGTANGKREKVTNRVWRTYCGVNNRLVSRLSLTLVKVCRLQSVEGPMYMRDQGQAKERYGRQLHARLAPHRPYAQGVQCFRPNALLCKLDLLRGETEDPRENPPVSGVVLRDSHHMRDSGGDPAGDRARFALARGEQSYHYTTAAPIRTKFVCRNHINSLFYGEDLVDSKYVNTLKTVLECSSGKSFAEINTMGCTSCCIRKIIWFENDKLDTPLVGSLPIRKDWCSFDQLNGVK
ncbi:hypothetical protein PR048_033233 [Dryococelus australis]|uniref:Uncharacterized protein n=1 Tax=Dryococelus australis TaxID=614101 RepID=A0ABQ9G0P1_9NEOP|nr:hypothetical protein PR048_033233 [Dryococelus australis]